MGQSRLSSLALMHIHYDIAVDLFAQMYPRKLELKNLLYKYSSNQGRNAEYVHSLSTMQLLLFHYVIFFTLSHSICYFYIVSCLV